MSNNFDFKRKLFGKAGSETDATGASIAEAPPSENARPNKTDGKLSVPPSIAKVDWIVKSVSDGPILEGGDENLTELGKPYRAAIGASVLKFLEGIHEDARIFVEALTQGGAKPDEAIPTDWIWPDRCRCWVRTETSSKAEEDKPRFALAFQVDLNFTEPKRSEEAPSQPKWRSKYELKNWPDGYDNNDRRAGGIAMEPFKPPQRSKASDGDGPRSDIGTMEQFKEPQAVKITIPGSATKELFHLFDDNPHLSFLLSRISAYPFSFLQRPRVIGKDIMAEILEKDPNLPWFVAPLIVSQEEQWRDDGRDGEKAGGDHGNLDAQTRLVGYLTFDEKKKKLPEKKQGNLGTQSDQPSKRVEIGGDWANFQNDLLHQMALFGACLAQNKCFQKPGSGGL